jgi:RNA polymerase sigma-70 factor (ECF subfamily)
MSRMAEDRPRNEETLWVLRAQTGDITALESLLARVEAPLFRYVATLVGEPDRAADVLQDTFVRIWRKLGWLRDPSLFRPWAYRIASREALRSLSRDRPWSDRADERELEALAASEPLTVDPGLRERLAGFVDALPPASRAVILLVYFEDFTLAETAAVLGVPPGTVRSRLAYGLSKLRGDLQVGGPGGGPTREPS